MVIDGVVLPAEMTGATGRRWELKRKLLKGV